MAGTSYLPLIVEVAFGEQPLDTGTLTWTDISDYVRRSGVDFLRGWDTETGEPIAGRLSFTLNNDSGDFTPGETGAFGEVRNRLPIRVSAVIGTATGDALTYDDEVGWYDMFGATYEDTEIGNVVLWTGLVESWRIFWENGVRSQVAVTCIDRWAAIRRLKFGADLYATLVKSQGANGYWPLKDATGSTRAVAAIGGQDLVLTGGSQPTWQGATLADGDGVVSIITPTQLTSAASGTYGASAAMSISGLFRPTVDLGVATITKHFRAFQSAGTRDMWIRQATSQTFSASVSDGTSLLSANGPASSAPANAWAHAAATLSVSGGTGTLTVYVNGVAGTPAVGAMTWGTVDTARIEGDAAAMGMGQMSVFPAALSAAQVLEQSKAAAGTWAGETAAVRAARLLTYIDPAPSLSTTGTFTSTMSKQDLADKSLGDALLECVTAERGTLYISRDGWPVLTSRSWRVGSPVSFTIPSHALAAEVAWTLDDQQLTNSSTVDRMVGDTSAGTARARNDASVATYGEQNKSLQVWLDTDAQLLERANAEANINAVAQPRSSDLMVDILTKSATISASTLLGADIGQRIAVSGMPATAPGQDEFYIDSISDKVTASGWERTFTVSPRADYFTIADATYGQLDNVFVLAF